MMIDTWGRNITYLRISVTDRCNLRCVYCMPADGVTWKSHSEILRYEEIVEFVKVAASQGIREIRLTGGEPLVRPDLDRLVGMIANIPGIEDISLTTNGLLLEKYAETLKNAGLRRINISMDTLNPDKFSRITRGGSMERVLRGMEVAEKCGLAPIKINCVAMRGVNDDELLEMARLTLNHPWIVRFIELMPIKNQEPWGAGFPDPQTMWISVQEILEMLGPLGLEPISGKVGDGPAFEYRLAGAKGKIGLISPMSEHHFCARCNRLRLTSDGYLRPCLMSDLEVSVKEALRSGESLLPVLEEAIRLKPQGHNLANSQGPTGRCMMQIGG